MSQMTWMIALMPWLDHSTRCLAYLYFVVIVFHFLSWLLKCDFFGTVQNKITVNLCFQIYIADFLYFWQFCYTSSRSNLSLFWEIEQDHCMYCLLGAPSPPSGRHVWMLPCTWHFPVRFWSSVVGCGSSKSRLFKGEWPELWKCLKPQQK